MSANKNRIMQDYVQTFLKDRYLTFQSVDMSPGARSLAPISGDTVIEKDVTGVSTKQYLFSFIGVETLDPGTNKNNADNQDLFEKFNDWIVEQENNKNYPDFGEKATNYKLEPLNNTADLAYIDENNNAKFILTVKLTYEEED